MIAASNNNCAPMPIRQMLRQRKIAILFLRAEKEILAEMFYEVCPDHTCVQIFIFDKSCCPTTFEHKNAVSSSRRVSSTEQPRVLLRSLEFRFLTKD